MQTLYHKLHLIGEWYCLSPTYGSLFPVTDAVSSTFAARRPPHTHKRQGRMLRTTFTTLSSRSRNVASMAKRMKHVWMELHLRMSIPSPSGSDFRPMRPLNRCQNVLATSARTPLISTNSFTHSQYRLISSTFCTCRAEIKGFDKWKQRHGCGRCPASSSRTSPASGSVRRRTSRAAGRCAPR